MSEGGGIFGEYVGKVEDAKIDPSKWVEEDKARAEAEDAAQDLEGDSQWVA